MSCLGRLVLLIWVFFCGVYSEKISWADCPEKLTQIASNDSSLPTSVFQKWSIGERNLHVTPQQLFPPAFLKEIEEKKGPIHVQVQHSWRDSSVKINGIVKKRTYFKVTFIENKNFPGKLLIDGLLVENPLDNKAETKLHQGQKSKGVPLSVFRHMTRQIFELAKAGGYDEVFTNTQQQFAVVMLYKRLLGMEPGPGAGTDLFNELEKIYSFARRELPEDIRPRDVREFTDLLGTASTWPSGYTAARFKKLWHYIKTGELDPSIRIFKDREGKPICAYFSDTESAEGKILFIYHHFGSPEVLKWADIANSRDLSLTKKF